jgi:hypothetical protein
MDNLRKQYVIMVNWCYLCKRNGEHVDHLLLHCDIACTIWNDFFRFAVFCGEIVFFPKEVKFLFTQFVVNSSFRAQTSVL